VVAPIPLGFKVPERKQAKPLLSVRQECAWVSADFLHEASPEYHACFPVQRASQDGGVTLQYLPLSHFQFFPPGVAHW
jgi:hypothetical protein